MAFNDLLQDANRRVGAAAERVAGAGLEFRACTARGLEAAIGTAAAAAAHAQLEAVLSLAPRLPFATAESVCDAFEEAASQAVQWLPGAVTAAVLGGDPRITPLVIGLLADEDLMRDALAQVGGLAGNSATLGVAAMQVAALPPALVDTLSSMGRVLGASLQGPSGDLIAQGRLAQAAVADARAGLGVAQAFAALVGGAVERVHLAAERGVNGVHAAALGQVRALRAGRLARVFPGRAGRRVSLERELTGIVAGSVVLLDKSNHAELFEVLAASQGSRAEYAISGKSSYLALSGQGLALFDHAVRETTVHARSQALALARAPVTTPVQGDTIQVAADVAGLVKGRRVIVAGPRCDDGAALVHHAVLVTATPAARAADGGTLVIDPPLPAPLRRDATVVYGNVALASHGETVAQVLGAGNPAQPHQRFELKHTPLTWRAAPSESGTAAELTVRVGDLSWAGHRSLHGAGPTERAFALTSDERGRTWVQFGDGAQGARPPSGVNNIRATYRKGIGAAGNVRAQALTQPASRPLGLKSVANLAPAVGGTDAQSADAARRSLPLQTRTLGRAVSVLDYEDFARAYAGVAKAQAAVLQLAAGPTVCITVAGAGGALLTPAHPVWANLLAALRASGDPHVPLRLLTHAAASLRVGLKVKVDPAYDSVAVLAAVEAALRAAYAFDARELGQPVQQSELIAVVHAVPGVVALDLDLLYGGSAPQAQTLASKQARLLAARMHVQGGQPRAAEVLTLAPGPLDSLEIMR